MSSSIKAVLKPHLRDIGNLAVRLVLPAMAARLVGPFIFFDHMARRASNRVPVSTCGRIRISGSPPSRSVRRRDHASRQPQFGAENCPQGTSTG